MSSNLLKFPNSGEVSDALAEGVVVRYLAKIYFKDEHAFDHMGGSITQQIVDRVKNSVIDTVERESYNAMCEWANNHNCSDVCDHGRDIPTDLLSQS